MAYYTQHTLCTAHCTLNTSPDQLHTAPALAIADTDKSVVELPHPSLLAPPPCHPHCTLATGLYTPLASSPHWPLASSLTTNWPLHWRPLLQEASTAWPLVWRGLYWSCSQAGATIDRGLPGLFIARRTALHYTALHYTALLHYTVQCSVVLYCPLKCALYTAWNCMKLHYTKISFSILY